MVLGSDLSFDQFGGFGLIVPQLTRHFAAEILVDLDNLQLRLGDLPFGLRRCRDQLVTLAVDADGLAFECS